MVEKFPRGEQKCWTVGVGNGHVEYPLQQGTRHLRERSGAGDGREERRRKGGMDGTSELAMTLVTSQPE